MGKLALVGERVTLRSVEPVDVDRLRAIQQTPEVGEWWESDPPEWPLDGGNPLTIWFEDEIVGFIQFDEQNSPRFRSATVDLFIDPAYHRRGFAVDAIKTLIDYLTITLGHHRITIDPCIDNAAAIRCYEQVGFERVGVMRRYWLDHNTNVWRDGLFMEYVAPS